MAHFIPTVLMCYDGIKKSIIVWCVVQKGADDDGWRNNFTGTTEVERVDDLMFLKGGASPRKE